MAALVAGVQYGLSSHSNFHENKSLIFVKLTDSAQRAIEDYIRNRNKINQNPTIQFLGNEGQLSFPSIKSNHGNFTFSLSSNQDIEGPQGGFECVQQIGPKNLESLGTLPCKMRIQANDDVYETTRYRMHVAEENNKNKCTRVIKASEPIGRKVKVKGTLRTIPPPGHTNSSASLRTIDSSFISTSTNLSTKLSSPYKSTSNNLVASRSQSDVQKKLNEIMRRPLKERLIHLLALRPFKRPELYDRINREGVREKEKNVIATILKQIAFMRDNTYHLHRCVWNDVQEDWPFYTEQEKAMLKRRKPQNLTPPGSSDGGSSGSGQSPNSTHPGSPPAITAPPLGLLGSKRPGYYQGNDGLPTKRQRISHYRKPESNYSTSSGDGVKSSSVSNIANSWDQRRQQRHQQHHLHYQQQQQKNNYVVTKSDLIPTSDGEEVNTGDLVVLSKANISSDPLSNNRISHNAHNNLDHSDHYYHQQRQNQELNRSISIRKKLNGNDEDTSTVTSTEFHSTSEGDGLSPIHVSAHRRIRDERKSFTEREKERNNPTELSYSLDKSSDIKISNSEGNTIRDSFLPFSTSSCNRVSPASSENFRNSEFSDNHTCYTTISSSEQRTRYKAEFNAYYREYRKLHVQVVKISKQFSQLEEELKEKLDSGNVSGYEAIKHQILQEYARTKNVNARFYYLHDKLGHIKKLVSEYDAQAHMGSSVFSNNSQTINITDLNDNPFHRDVRQTLCALTQIPAEQPLTCSSKMPHIS